MWTHTLDVFWRKQNRIALQAWNRSELLIFLLQCCTKVASLKTTTTNPQRPHSKISRRKIFEKHYLSVSWAAPYLFQLAGRCSPPLRRVFGRCPAGRHMSDHSDADSTARTEPFRCDEIHSPRRSKWCRNIELPLLPDLRPPAQRQGIHCFLKLILPPFLEQVDSSNTSVNASICSYQPIPFLMPSQHTPFFFPCLDNAARLDISTQGSEKKSHQVFMTPVDQRVAIKESAHSSCEDPVAKGWPKVVTCCIPKIPSLKNR